MITMGFQTDVRAQTVFSKFAETQNKSVVHEFKGEKGVMLQDGYVVVHTTCADPRQKTLEAYAASLVDELIGQADRLQYEVPLALAPVIRTQKGDAHTLSRIVDALVARAVEKEVAILEGAHVTMGEYLPTEANITGTMLGVAPLDILDQSELTMQVPYKFLNQGLGPDGAVSFELRGTEHRFAMIEAFSKNSQDVRTPLFFRVKPGSIAQKTVLYSKFKKQRDAALDWVALADHACEREGFPCVLTGFIEYRGRNPIDDMLEGSRDLAREYDLIPLISSKRMPARLRGHTQKGATFQMDGCIVSAFDPAQRLLYGVQQGHYVVALRKGMTPGVHGVLDMDALLEDMMIEKDWHETYVGGYALEYLLRPSQSLFPLLQECKERNLVSGVYVLNGSGYNGSFARDLEDSSLYAMLEVVPPHWLEGLLSEHGQLGCEAFEQWTHGYSCLVTTKKFSNLAERARAHGCDYRVLGQVGYQSGQRGIVLKTPSGEKFEFMGY